MTGNDREPDFTGGLPDGKLKWIKEIVSAHFYGLF